MMGSPHGALFSFLRGPGPASRSSGAIRSVTATNPALPALVPRHCEAAEGVGRGCPDSVFLTQNTSLGGARCRGVWEEAALEAPPRPMQALPLSFTSCHGTLLRGV